MKGAADDTVVPTVDALAMPNVMQREPTGAIIASANSRQFSRPWSGPANPSSHSGQQPGAVAPVVEVIASVGTNVADLKGARLADLAEIADRIRARIKRSTADVIATGSDLLLAQQRIGAGDLLAWVESELGMTRRWAQLQMVVAKTFGEVGEVISSVPPTTIYKLAAPSTPDSIKSEVIADLRAGRTVDHRAVEQRIKAGSKKGQAAEKTADSATVSADLDQMSDADLDAEHARLLEQLRGLYGLFERLQSVEETLQIRRHDKLYREMSKKQLRKAVAGWTYGGRIIAVLANIYYDDNGILRPEIASGRARS